MSRSQMMTADVAALLRARNCFLWVVTAEEERVEGSLVEAAKQAKFDVRFWDIAQGIQNAKGDVIKAANPIQVLGEIRGDKTRAVWVLRDKHHFVKDPVVQRSMRNLARALPLMENREARAMIVLSPSAQVPPELAGHAVVVDWPLPDREEIGAILADALAALAENGGRGDVTAAEREAAIDAAVGLSASEAQNCYAKSSVVRHAIDPKIVVAEKKRVIERERVLQWYEPEPRGLEAVGGLENLKRWLTQRRSAFSQRARAFGLPAPRGVLFVGPPGNGKSLCAKAIASAWGMPLLRLDLGALKSKWVGDSEQNIRKALQVAEAVAPCILWIDEIEKGLGGAISGASDGGVSSDALGTLLSWMQERKAPCFLVATSNDVSALPPELLRKERFDEIWYLDLPQPAERKQVLVATLVKHERGTDRLDVDAVVEVTKDFTGAEVAALVPEALYAAFLDDERPLKTEDLLAVAATTVPLSMTAKEKIDRLREWAKLRARAASGPESQARVVTGGKRKLDL